LEKIQVAAVSYLNTKPLIYGFEQGRLKELMEIRYEYPAKVASLLISGKVDIGLVPVAVIPLMQEHFIIADYGIGSDNEVASVCLFSDVPLHEISKIYLDYQSRTSVALIRILLKEHWKISPELIPATEGYEENIEGNVAGLVIGDRALSQRNRSKYIFDLSTAWKEMTNLPFVFAAWVANKKLPDQFLSGFNDATAECLNHLDEIASKETFMDYDLKKYYTENINYPLNAEHLKGMKLFLELMKK
jgi:chorismate dehydratase